MLFEVGEILILARVDTDLYTDQHHIYMADSSRVSIAGLNASNVDYVAAAIDTVVRTM